MKFLNPSEYNKWSLYEDGEVVIGTEGELWVLYNRFWRKRGRRVE